MDRSGAGARDVEPWRDATLRRLVTSHAAALLGLDVRLEVGDQDPVAEEVKRLSAELQSLGVDHELVVFADGHVAGVRRQFETSVFQVFTRALTARTP